MKLTLRREGDRRGWPHYLLWGRMRTSTVALIVAFFATWWLYATYQPPAPAAPGEQAPVVVPPGFVPDPEYTWVPRTNVEEWQRTTTPTTTTSTTETSTTDTTPTDTDTTTPTDGTDPTTVVDPDGPGPLPATTLSPAPDQTPSTIPTTPTSAPSTTTPGPLNPQR